MDKITKAFSSDISVSDGERAVVARITTSAVDRDGECLVAQGMNAKDFEKNPIVFLGHDYYTLPVGKVTSLKRDDSGVTAKIVFADRPAAHPTDEEWLPDTLLSLFQQKVLNGFSVGFLPVESRPATDRDVEKFGAGVRRVYSKWNLLELSVAPLPCNQDAVALAVSKGMVGAAAAKAIWDVEAKAADPALAKDHTDAPRQACDGCGEMYPPDDLEAVDGKMLCEKCMAAAKSIAPAPELEPEPPVKHVVASVEFPPEEKPVARVKHVHRVLCPARDDSLVRVRKLVTTRIKKLQGKLYLD